MLHTIITWNIWLYVTLDICSNFHQCKLLYPFVGTPVISVTVIGLVPIEASAAAAAAKSLQSCPTLCDPIDGSPPASPVPGILQARTLEWVAISFSNAWKWKVKVKLLSHIRLFATPWTAAFQAPPSMGFSRQEYWSGLPLPSPIKAGDYKCLRSFLSHLIPACMHIWITNFFYQNRAITNSYVYYAF